MADVESEKFGLAFIDVNSRKNNKIKRSKILIILLPVCNVEHKINIVLKVFQTDIYEVHLRLMFGREFLPQELWL